MGASDKLGAIPAEESPKGLVQPVGPPLVEHSLYIFPDKTYVYCEWAVVRLTRQSALDLRPPRTCLPVFPRVSLDQRK
jgi:hypothetical protein